MATVFTIMSYGGLALAVICLIIAVILFIKWNIPKVFGNVTGRTQRKTIERIRKEGYEANATKQSAIKAAGETGKITVRKTETDSLQTGRTTKQSKNVAVGTPPIANPARRETAVTKENVTNTVFQVYQPGEVETTVLSDPAGDEETMVLNQSNSEEQTTVLNQSNSEEQTTLLNQPNSEEQTTVLNQPETENQTAVLSQYTPEEGTTVLSRTSAEEGTTVLQADEKQGGQNMHPSEVSTTILTENQVEGVIQLPEETITAPGTVAKVLDFIMTHTDEGIQ
ncbi:MAG: hypothetical protein PUA59_02255 [Clostridium sp.]|nr:hypothetical protein [Clostridium sp.]